MTKWILIFLLLTGCGGPPLFTIGGMVEVTAGDVVTSGARKVIIDEVTEEQEDD